MTMNKTEALRTIGLIRTAGKKLDARIHAVAVAGLQHAYEHGDFDILSDLVLAMPKSGRGNALQFWITKHIELKWDKKARNGKQGYVKVGKFAEDYAPIIDAADQEPFWEKKDTEAPVFKPEQYAKSVASKLKKEGMSFDEFVALLREN